MNVTARLALQIISEHLHNEPVFLCIDDTLIAKSVRNLKTFQNSLTMLHITAQTISTDTAL